MPLTVDKIFVWGRPQADKLSRWGVDPAQIEVSGCSYYSSYQKLSVEAARLRVCRGLKLDPARKIILVAFPPASGMRYPFEHKLKFKLILPTLSLLKEFPEAQIIVKLHPGAHDLEFYSQWLSQAQSSNNFSIIADYDPLLLARACHFLIVHASTYAVDGLAMDKPVVCLYDSWHPILEEYRRFQCFYYAESFGELRSAVHNLLEERDDLSKQRHQARLSCLNENDRSPESIISDFCTKAH